MRIEIWDFYLYKNTRIHGDKVHRILLERNRYVYSGVFGVENRKPNRGMLQKHAYNVGLQDIFSKGIFHWLNIV